VTLQNPAASHWYFVVFDMISVTSGVFWKCRKGTQRHEKPKEYFAFITRSRMLFRTRTESKTGVDRRILC
jgi:hypothetical protein